MFEKITATTNNRGEFRGEFTDGDFNLSVKEISFFLDPGEKVYKVRIVPKKGRHYELLEIVMDCQIPKNDGTEPYINLYCSAIEHKKANKLAESLMAVQKVTNDALAILDQYVPEVANAIRENM